MKILLILTFFISYSTYSCEVSLKLKLGNTSFDYDLIKSKIEKIINIKNYQLSDTPTQLMEIKLFKRSDFHNPRLLYPYSSVAVRKVLDGEMLFYTHGNGKQYQNHQDAYSIDNFSLAIKNAIEHLPNCN